MPPARRKLQGTMASAILSARLWTSAFRPSDSSIIAAILWMRVSLSKAVTRTASSPSSTSVPA